MGRGSKHKPNYSSKAIIQKDFKVTDFTSAVLVGIFEMILIS